MLLSSNALPSLKYGLRLVFTYFFKTNKSKFLDLESFIIIKYAPFHSKCEEKID